MEMINPQGWLRAPGWSHGIAENIGARSYVKIAGQVGWDMTTQKLVSDDLVEQYEKALSNICEIVKAAGGEPNQVSELRIYVTSVADFNARGKEAAQAYRNHFGKHFPAITLLGVNELFMKDIKVEVEAAAFVDRVGGDR